jgi:hypothetical protein
MNSENLTIHLKHYCTSHAFGFSGGPAHSHLPVCEL